MRPRATILVKLLLAVAAPTLALFAVFAVVAYEVTRRDLDAELGTRLTAVAASAATEVRGKYLVQLGEGNDAERAHQNVVAKLQAVAAVTGVRLYVFDRQFASRADTDPDVAIGTVYYQAELDRVELDRVFAGGVAASVTFEDRHGTMYKVGYAPVYASETDATVVLAIGAQAPATYFARLASLRRSLLLWGVGLLGLVLVATFGVAVLITRPARVLAAAATRIGAGDLSAPIAPAGRDELGVLAATMETMRRQLAERDARTQQMLAGIAHEVRNPLAGIQLYAGILRDELEGDPRAAHAAKIDREVGYLERVVREFAEFARRPPPEPAVVDVRALFEDTAELVARDAGEAGLDVELEVEQGLTVTADPGQLRRVVLNLAKNAIQAAASVGERGAAVRLEARAVGGDVVLEVWNRGPTIEPSVSGKIFDPFFTTREKGTGLGLAFVRELVRAHGGEVTVTSEEGETRFRVTLPRVR
ncbi:MAG TPA: HAMP domain-containing sensor histidine kinase [Kofleriaceae bacterium]|nr:HAMP domain-containing sensor histidine kinase [Kofleriaceae bacterium]